MLTTHSGSYYDEYRKMKGLGPSRAPGGGGPGDASRGPHGGSTSTDVRAGLVSERLLTDRASYISFLEVQLERVSAACITTQGFDERLEDLAGTVVAMEEKLRNLARVVKLTQAYAEAAGGDAARALDAVGEEVGGLKSKVERAAVDISSLRDASVGVGAEVESQLDSVSRVEDAQSAIADDVAALRDRVDSLHSSVDGMQGKVEAAAAAARPPVAPTAPGALASIESRLGGVDARAEARSAALAARLDELERRCASQDRAIEEERSKRAELAAALEASQQSLREARAAADMSVARSRTAEDAAARALSTAEAAGDAAGRADAHAAAAAMSTRGGSAAMSFSRDASAVGGSAMGAEDSMRLDTLEARVDNLSRFGPAAGGSADGGVSVPAQFDQLSRQLNARLTDQIARVRATLEARVDERLSAVPAPASAPQPAAPAGDAASKPAADANDDSDGEPRPWATLDAVEGLRRRIDAVNASLSATVAEQGAAVVDAAERADAAEVAVRRVADDAVQRNTAQGQRLMRTLQAMEARFSAMLGDLSPETLEARVTDAVTRRVARVEEAVRGEEARASRIEEALRAADMERQALASTLALKTNISGAAHEEAVTKVKAQVLAEIGDIVSAVEHRLERRVASEVGMLTARDERLREERAAMAEDLEARIRDGVSRIDRFMTLYNSTHAELSSRLQESHRSQVELDRAITAASLSVVGSPDQSPDGVDDGASDGYAPAGLSTSVLASQSAVGARASPARESRSGSPVRLAGLGRRGSVDRGELPPRPLSRGAATRSPSPYADAAYGADLASSASIGVASAAGSSVSTKRRKKKKPATVRKSASKAGSTSSKRSTASSTRGSTPGRRKVVVKRKGKARA